MAGLILASQRTPKNNYRATSARQPRVPNLKLGSRVIDRGAMAPLVQQMAPAGTTPNTASQAHLGTPRLLNSPPACLQAAAAPQQPRRRVVHCQAAARAFGGAPEPGRHQPPAAVASRAAEAADLLPAAQCLGDAPQIDEQLRQLQGLLARLGRAATYGDKVHGCARMAKRFTRANAFGNVAPDV